MKGRIIIVSSVLYCSDEKKGKTFDEIREENRAKQMQRRYPQRPREDEREIRPQSTPKNEGTNSVSRRA